MYMDWTEIVSAKRKNNGILKFNMGYDDKTLHSLKTEVMAARSLGTCTAI